MRERTQSTRESLAGSLLLAHPVLRDPNFRRTAVLMSTHGPEGAMGVVLNRPLGKRLGELKVDFSLGPSRVDPDLCRRPRPDRAADPGRLAGQGGRLPAALWDRP